MFLPALTGYWLADDFDWVHDFYRYPWSDIPRLFLGDWSRTMAHEYRPLWAISFMTDLDLWGPNPLALHVTNLGLHLAVCVLVWYLTQTVPGGTHLAANLALAFFVLAPIHAEPVAWISARGHILAPIFILGTVILLRRFETRGSQLSYPASLGCAVAAFATQEVAVALPPLLLLRDLVDAPQRDRQWLRRTAVVHAPFWVLLLAYLGFRYIIFGMLARAYTPTSVPELMYGAYLGVRTLWLSPSDIAGLSRGASAVSKAVFLLIAALLLTPLFSERAPGRRDLARELIFFGVLWPLVSTSVLFGAHSGRHFYLASIGVAIACGLAGSCLLAGNRRVARAGLAIIGLLLVICGVALTSRIRLYARNGRLSRALAQEVDRVLEDVVRDKGAAVVIIPEFPQSQVVFWDYFYITALSPPFRNTRPPADRVLPSFASCHCRPEQWKADHAVALALLNDNRTSAIHLVVWDAQQSAFVTRVLSQPAFWQAGYAAPGGPLVRPRRPGLPEPVLP